MRSERFAALFEWTNDAVVEVEVVEQEPLVRAVNPAFVDTFGYERAEIRGESLHDYIVPDRRSGETVHFDRQAAERRPNKAIVARQTTDGVREFYYRGMPVAGDRRLAIYTDVTDRRRMEQHHQVLHRVLRHNLRNKLVPLLDGSETLSSELSGELGEQAALMAAAAEELADLSETAGKVEYIMESSASREMSVDLAAVLRSVVEEYAERAEIDLSVKGDRAVPVAADDQVEIALTHLVENGIQHNDGRPRLAVSLRTDGGEAVTEITDNGPGIPENERAVIFGDQPVSQLRHSTGLGLWLTKWILERYGGRLAYDRQGGQTTVTLRLPLATERASVGARGEYRPEL